VKTLTTACVCIFLFFNHALASDLAKEARWADQIVEALLDGEEVWLSLKEHEFLAIDTPAENNASNKALIVIHGTGAHPDWEQVVKPIRVEMTKFGWRTLSIQMPILANSAKSDDYIPLYSEVAERINAAQDYLQKNGVETIVIAAHSMGASMSAYYLATEELHSIKALVAIGLNAAQSAKHINAATSLEQLTLPVLDLYGSNDLASVLTTATLRQTAADKAGNTQYSQVIVEGAEHFFDGKEKQLLEELTAWLKKQQF
jgi:pimeloyl-ACP methyl ester carboxylesterase